MREDVHFNMYSSGLTLRNVARLKKADHLAVTSKGYEAIGPITFLEFNLRKPPFNDIRVRQAIAHAMDRDFITQKLLQGLSRKATGPIVQGFPYYTEYVKKYEFDLEKANKLLDEAGYPKKSDGMRFSTTMHWYPDAINQQMPAEYLKPALAKIGIEVQLRPPPDFGTWVKTMAGWNHQLSMNAIFSYGDPVIGVHRLYLCDNIKNVVWTNTAGYCNPKADEIVAKAGQEMDLDKRKALYAQWQQMVVEDLPLVWTHEQPYFTIYHKNLKNVPLGIWGILSPFDQTYWKDGKEPK
jgi:peptide/nickel transport system substrate-binding protein